jgi:hypothetical protein
LWVAAQDVSKIGWALELRPIANTRLRRFWIPETGDKDEAGDGEYCGHLDI